LTIPEMIALSGLITVAIIAWKLNKRYDLKKDEMNPIVRRKYQ